MGPDFPWRRVEGREELGVRVTWGGCQEPASPLDTPGELKAAPVTLSESGDRDELFYVAQS